MKTKTIVATVLLFSCLEGYAQNTLITDDVLISPKFFVAIIAGVLMAIAFQFVLTALSVAFGITMVGDVKKKYVKSKVEPSDTDRSEYEFDQDYSAGTSTGVKVVSGVGLWSLLTSCISLFVATTLALKLSVFGNEETDMVVALVIWSLFFLLLFYLESKLLNTVVGGLINTATSGLKASANTVKNMIAPSNSVQIEKMIEKTVDKIKQEMNPSAVSSELSSVLDNFLNRVDNKIPDYEELKADLENIANESSSKNTSGSWMAIQQVLTKAIEKKSSNSDESSKGKVARLKELLEKAKTAYDKDEGKVAGIKNVIAEFTDADKATIDEKINQAKSYFSTASEDDLSIESLRKNLKEIINDPKVITTLLSNQFSDFDSEQITAFLSQNTQLDKSKLDTYANQIKNAIEKLTAEFDKENDENMMKKMENSVANYFNRTEKSELNYEDLKRDVIQMFNNPKDSFDIVRNRFEKFDSSTVKALLTNNSYVEKSHIQKVITSFEEAKAQAKSKFTEIETKATQQVELLKRKSVIQAEHARKTAMAASWWLVITAVASAAAAIAGGAL